MAQPHAVCLDTERQRLFIADTFNHRVIVVSLPDGHFMFKFGSEGAGACAGGLSHREIERQRNVAMRLRVSE